MGWQSGAHKTIAACNALRETGLPAIVVPYEPGYRTFIFYVHVRSVPLSPLSNSPSDVGSNHALDSCSFTVVQNFFLFRRKMNHHLGNSVVCAPGSNQRL